MPRLAAHPASGISSWADWPDDVRDILRAWNKERFNDGYRLRFEMTSVLGLPPSTFICRECLEEHYEPDYGVALFEGKTLCDPCLIASARRSI
jgi:hypothetical protein